MCISVCAQHTGKNLILTDAITSRSGNERTLRERRGKVVEEGPVTPVLCGFH